jgi:gas vesicle protein
MSNKSNALIGIVAGAALGATLGVLFAPDKGTKTRKKIKKSALSAKDELVTRTNELTSQLTSKFNSHKADFEAKLDGMVSEMSDKAEDVITTLEKKLEALKKENAKVKKATTTK